MLSQHITSRPSLTQRRPTQCHHLSANPAPVRSRPVFLDALLFKIQRSLAENPDQGSFGRARFTQQAVCTLPQKLMWALSRLAGAKRFVPVQSTVASLTTAAPAKPPRSLGLRALLAVPVAAFAGWIVSDKDRAVLAVALPTRFVRVVATAATITLGATGLAQHVGCRVT